MHLKEMDLMEILNIDKAIELDSVHSKHSRYQLLKEILVKNPLRTQEKTRSKENTIHSLPKVFTDEQLFHLLHRELSHLFTNSCVYEKEYKTIHNITCPNKNVRKQCRQRCAASTEDIEVHTSSHTEADEDKTVFEEEGTTAHPFEFPGLPQTARTRVLLR
ncbi:uncharacterized protein LOC126379622 [Pectinophora gossypiella]|uniref:uncharacterized protein LOC126379622 n=1 Tax=Pectinophora gossypiella TaxID=13191 RepID=UPI00214EE7EC|nr:uncharacterized protein LOC126379622 [Pectinophora gossypiella]